MVACAVIETAFPPWESGVLAVRRTGQMVRVLRFELREPYILSVSGMPRFPTNAQIGVPAQIRTEKPHHLKMRGMPDSHHKDVCLSGTQPTAPLWLTHNGHDAPCKPSTLKNLWSERQDLNLRKTPVPKTGGLTKLAYVPLSIPRGRSVYYHTLTDLSARLLFILRTNSVRTFNLSWPLGIFHLSGWRYSKPHQGDGNPVCYHYTTAAYKSID